MQRYYDIVASELKTRHLKDGLWARALAETGADDSKARATYIRLRADELRREDEAKYEAQRLAGLHALQAEEEREFSKEATHGPSFTRVLLIVLTGFAVFASIWATVSAFR